MKTNIDLNKKQQDELKRMEYDLDLAWYDAEEGGMGDMDYFASFADTEVELQEKERK